MSCIKARGQFDPQKVNALAFEPVVAVEPISINQCDMAFAILGGDFSAPCLA